MGGGVITTSVLCQLDEDGIPTPISATNPMSISGSSIVSTTAPSAASDPGTPGQLATDGDYLYVCVDVDTWKRVAIATW